eukprot:4370222-Pleurochrysis_carterae.AAC.1
MSRACASDQECSVHSLQSAQHTSTTTYEASAIVASDQSVHASPHPIRERASRWLKTRNFLGKQQSSRKPPTHEAFAAIVAMRS